MPVATPISVATQWSWPRAQPASLAQVLPLPTLATVAHGVVGIGGMDTDDIVLGVADVIMGRFNSGDFRPVAMPPTSFGWPERFCAVESGSLATVICIAERRRRRFGSRPIGV